MRNTEIAAALSELGTLYELDGAVRYRVNAYREAARVSRDSPISVEELDRAGGADASPRTRSPCRESRPRRAPEPGPAPPAGSARGPGSPTPSSSGGPPRRGACAG